MTTRLTQGAIDRLARFILLAGDDPLMKPVRAGEEPSAKGLAGTLQIEFELSVRGHGRPGSPRAG